MDKSGATVDGDGIKSRSLPVETLCVGTNGGAIVRSRCKVEERGRSLVSRRE